MPAQRRWCRKPNATCHSTAQEQPDVECGGTREPEPEIISNATTELPSRRCLVGAPADLFSEARQRFADSLDLVKLNFSFHDRKLELPQYRAWACQLRELGLSAIVKASRLATHDRQLQGVEDWWPKMKAAYMELHKQGVLEAVLWQCPPSLRCSEESCKDLERVCNLLCSWVGTRHVFEFRHASWYSSERAVQILQQHGCCLAWLNLREAQAREWTDLDGWSLRHSTADFLYLQLHGTEGRALGKYSDEFLKQLAERLPQDKDIMSIFCQVDVPSHAWSNAATMREALRPPIKAEGKSEGKGSAGRVWRAASKPEETKNGQVVKLTPRLILLDINGRTGVLGRSHLRASTLKTIRIGDVLSGLRVEADEGQRLWLSMGQDQELPAAMASSCLDGTASDGADSLAELLKEIEEYRLGDDEASLQQNDRWSVYPNIAAGDHGYHTAALASSVVEATVEAIAADGLQIVLSTGQTETLHWQSVWGGKRAAFQVGDVLSVVLESGGRATRQRLGMAVLKHMQPWAPNLQD